MGDRDAVLLKEITIGILSDVLFYGRPHPRQLREGTVRFHLAILPTNNIIISYFVLHNRASHFCNINVTAQQRRRRAREQTQPQPLMALMRPFLSYCIAAPFSDYYFVPIYGLCTAARTHMTPR